ncbi:MAG TPA: hypothetical protein VIC55_07045 [Gemmatimonadaceae bacterium]
MIWIWLALIDAIVGHPFETAGFLGSGLGSIFLQRGASPPAWLGVLIFTVFHFAIWILVGIIIVATIRSDDGAPGVVLWPPVSVLLLQVGFTGWAVMLAQGPLGRHAWPAIIGGELLGWVALAWYLVRRDPGLWQRMEHDAET